MLFDHFDPFYAAVACSFSNVHTPVLYKTEVGAGVGARAGKLPQKVSNFARSYPLALALE